MLLIRIKRTAHANQAGVYVEQKFWNEARVMPEAWLMHCSPESVHEIGRAHV